MTYTVLPSKRFLRAVKRYRTQHRSDVLDAAEEVTQLLAAHDARALYILQTRWRDHMLHGDMQGIRELHLGSDDLLLYVVDTEARIVELLDIVTHDELEKM